MFPSLKAYKFTGEKLQRPGVYHFEILNSEMGHHPEWGQYTDLDLVVCEGREAGTGMNHKIWNKPEDKKSIYFNAVFSRACGFSRKNSEGIEEVTDFTYKDLIGKKFWAEAVPQKKDPRYVQLRNFQKEEFSLRTEAVDFNQEIQGNSPAIDASAFGEVQF